MHFLQITASPMLMEKDGDNLPEEVVEKRAVVSKDYRRDIKGKNSMFLSGKIQCVTRGILPKHSRVSATPAKITADYVWKLTS